MDQGKWKELMEWERVRARGGAVNKMPSSLAFKDQKNPGRKCISPFPVTIPKYLRLPPFIKKKKMFILVHGPRGER